MTQLGEEVADAKDMSASSACEMCLESEESLLPFPLAGPPPHCTCRAQLASSSSGTPWPE